MGDKTRWEEHRKRRDWIQSCPDCGKMTKTQPNGTLYMHSHRSVDKGSIEGRCPGSGKLVLMKAHKSFAVEVTEKEGEFIAKLIDGEVDKFQNLANKFRNKA